MALKFPISLVGKRESLQEETQVIDTNEDVIATIIGDIPNGYFDLNTNVRRVIVGSSCTSIGSTAFRCASPYALREVNFTNAVNLITIGGQLSFSRARYLNTDLIFPDSLQTFGGADVFNIAGAGGVNTACKYIYFGKDTQSFGAQNFGYFAGVTRVDMNMLNVPSSSQLLIGNSIAVIHAPSNSNFQLTYQGFTVVKDLPAL